MSVASGLRHATAVLCAALSIASCESARHVRDMQDNFDKGSKLVNKYVLEEASERRFVGDPGELQKALFHYRMARSLAAKEVAENRADLVKDGLLDHVYAIWAASLWQIGDLSEVATIDKGNLEVDTEAELKSVYAGICPSGGSRAFDVGPLNGAILASVPAWMEFTKARLSLKRAPRDLATKSTVDGFVCSGIVNLEPVPKSLGLPLDHGFRTTTRLQELSGLGLSDKAIETLSNSGVLTARNAIAAKSAVKAEAKTILCDLVHDGPPLTTAEKKIAGTVAFALGVDSPHQSDGEIKPAYSANACKTIKKAPSLCSVARGKAVLSAMAACLAPRANASP